MLKFQSFFHLHHDRTSKHRRGFFCFHSNTLDYFTTIIYLMEIIWVQNSIYVLKYNFISIHLKVTSRREILDAHCVYIPKQIREVAFEHIYLTEFVSAGERKRDFVTAAVNRKRRERKGAMESAATRQRRSGEKSVSGSSIECQRTTAATSSRTTSRSKKNRAIVILLFKWALY